VKTGKPEARGPLEIMELLDADLRVILKWILRIRNITL